MQSCPGQAMRVIVTRYSLGYGITIAPCAPTARIHPAQQPREQETSFFGMPFGPAVLPNLWRLGGDHGHERHIDWHVKIGG